MQDLGTLGGQTSAALGISPDGKIVLGHARTSANVAHAFLWQDGVMHDLNVLVGNSAPGWTLREAWAINSAGHIVGTGINSLGRPRAFLLTTAVPEPSVFGSALGSGMLLLRRRRRAR